MILALNQEQKLLLAQAFALDAGISLVSRSDAVADHCLGILRRTAMFYHLLQHILTSYDTAQSSIAFEDIELSAIRGVVTRVLVQATEQRQREGYFYQVDIGAERLDQVASIPTSRQAMQERHEIHIAAMVINFYVGDRFFHASDFAAEGGIEETCAAMLLASQLYGVSSKLHRHSKDGKEVSVTSEQLLLIREAAAKMLPHTAHSNRYQRSMSIDTAGLRELQTLLLK